MSSACGKIIIETMAVIFDMDGVITDTMPYHFKAWEKAFSEVLGYRIREKDIYLREGSKGAFALEEIFKEYGWSHQPDILNQLLMKKEEVFPQIVKIEFIKGSLEFLSSIKAQGFQTALVTGTSLPELKKMLSHDIQSSFNVILTGSDVVHGKPNPEPYLTALKKLKLNSSDAVVLENAPLGIKSAKAAGLRCLALSTSLSREYLHEADFIFKSYDDINQHVQFFKAKRT
ncbi:MAG: HAD family phosphatase [Candidatus Omnitrophota bacterium]